MLLFQSTGTFIAVSRYASATMIPPSVLGRGIGWQVTELIIIHHKLHFLLASCFWSKLVFIICRALVLYWVHFLGQLMELRCQCKYNATI